MKDIRFEMNTGTSGRAEYVTPVIKGELAAVMISSDTITGVNISFEEDESIVLYDDIQFIGIRYLPLGIEMVFRDGDKLKNSLVSWSLNNKLRIRVKGKIHSQIKFIIRYKEM